ncbi:MAG: glutamate mutase L [Spirochaetaceae bacterium]|nr:glutamate mutase L [Spirochaetaceae bacterium]
MKKYIDVLVAEIGSTTTLVNAFTGIDGDAPVFWAQGQAPTSVLDGDVRIGLEGAVKDLCKNVGVDEVEWGEMLATSSAAGGLRMTVHGLVYDMTARAAKEAALGAGAIIHMVTSGVLRPSDVEKIRAIRPNIIMLSGGVDHGERETALANGQILKDTGLPVPVIYAGNVDNQADIKALFGDGNGLYIVENVYPKIDELNVEPARKVIQAVFEEHIVRAPGMEHVREMVNGSIIPTPGAVMESTRLLAEVLGDVLTLDVGGATTDVHSVTKGSEEIARILVQPEPEAKRTVEGDLGVYVNMENVIALAGKEKLEAELGFPLDDVKSTYKFIPKTEDEIRFVEALTREAVLKAVERHAGRVRYVYGPTGRSTLAEGKDLTEVKYIIGTGGALTRLPGRVKIMEGIAAGNKTGLMLFPSDRAQILVDNDYIMASLGVLSKNHPDSALKLLKKSLGKTA